LQNARTCNAHYRNADPINQRLSTGAERDGSSVTRRF
jgi:hypothetical protein